LRAGRGVATARLPETHPLVLTIDGSLATMIAALGRDAEAERLFKRTLAARIEALGADHPDVANNLLAYGRFLAERKRYAEAEPLLVQSHAMRRKLLGDKHPETIRSARQLIALYQAIGEEDKAQATERTIQ
jgi:hypothetical protein